MALIIVSATLMEAEAGLGERSEERLTSRNGYRERPLDTRVRTVELRIPEKHWR